jgi:hypothetical protein
VWRASGGGSCASLDALLEGRLSSEQRVNLVANETEDVSMGGLVLIASQRHRNKMEVLRRVDRANDAEVVLLKHEPALYIHIYIYIYI